MRAGLRLGEAARSAAACHYADVSFPEWKPLLPSSASACRGRSRNASVGLRTPLAPRRRTHSFSSLHFNCQPSWLLRRASLSQPRTECRWRALARTHTHACTHGGTKHSISASDITAVSSAVSACAINSAAERANWLCRKDGSGDPGRAELLLAWLKLQSSSVCSCAL